MTSVSQKCQYALRAVFELGKKRGQGPTSVSRIAESQAIPVRFLEVILGQLKQHGVVRSRRGVQGGYLLARTPREVPVGEIVRIIDGPLSPVNCLDDAENSNCELQGGCAFRRMWERVRDAVSNVYDSVSFQDLIDEEIAHRSQYVPQYEI